MDNIMSLNKPIKRLVIHINGSNKFQHLADHDYLETYATYMKKKPKVDDYTVKITQLKAIYHCQRCGYITMMKDKLTEHMDTHKTPNAEYVSHINFDNNINIPKWYTQCPKCTFYTRDKESLKVHIQSHQFTKPLAKSVKNTNTNIENYNLNCKSTEKLQLPQYIPCTSCNKGRNIPEGYQTCPECTYYTKNKASLKVHMKIHLKGTPYKCTDCEYFGRDLKELIRHYSDTKDLQCDRCNYATHVKQQLVSHLRIHTGERPYKCGVCNYTSPDRSNLHRHLKIHMQS